MATTRLPIRTRIGLLCCIVISPLLSACFPGVDTFYEPLAETGKVMKKDCHGHVGARNIIMWEVGATKLIVQSTFSSSEGSHPEVTIWFWLKPEQTVSFGSLTATVIWGKESKDIEPIRLKRYSYETNLTVRPPLFGFPGPTCPKCPPSLIDTGPSSLIELPLSQAALLQGGDHVQYYVEYSLPFNETNSFSMRLPSLTVNGTAFMFPEINWHRVTTWDIYPINC